MAEPEKAQKPQEVASRIVAIGPKTHVQRETSDSYNSYASNTISTSKYTLLSFFPKCIFDQFRKVSYIFQSIHSLTFIVATFTLSYCPNINMKV